MREKLEKEKKGKKGDIWNVRNISANTFPVTSEKISDQPTFSATSYQQEGSEPLQRIYSTILEFRITRLLIIHKDSS